MLRLALLVLLLAAVPGDLKAREDAACYPPPAPNEPHFVIGYGSLMEKASKDRSWPSSGVGLPVRVRGFERSWSARARTIGFGATLLGVARKDGADMVAALFRVLDPADFRAGDARERAYCRVEIAPSHVTLLDGSRMPSEGKIWIYLLQPDHRRPADARHPIVQSYVDIFLSGCIGLSHLVVEDLDFLAECITTTQAWPLHWVNDRIYPRRPFHQPNATRIDEILHRKLPRQFEAIRIE